MSFRGGRDRPRKDYPLRPEEKSHHSRSAAPPSRHLWVGNLSHTLTERALSNHFRQFGELESVAFQPGRSYAFINFIDDGAAFAAYGALQGFVLAGNALRIEFTKAEKSSASSHDEDYLHRRDEPRSSLRGSPFPQRDNRVRHVSSDPIYDDENSKTNSKNGEPSEVLWVGFPQSLNVDEDSLWNAFSPFGEIEKVSAFPGRTYGFVRFKHVSSACRAKDHLQGKLFGNPRVHIRFAKSESNNGRNSMNNPPSPRIRPYGRQGSSENFRHDRYHETSSMNRSRRSPRYDDVIDFDRKGNRLTGRNIPFEQQRPDTGLPKNIYGRHSPSRDRGGGNFHDFAPRNYHPRQGSLYDDEWDLPEDALVYHGAKKLKSSLPVPPEPELPEYPFSESEQVKHVLPRPPEYTHHELIDDNLPHFAYHKQIPESHGNIPKPYDERGNSHNAAYDAFQNHVEWNQSTPEPPASEEWKWEGIIAKGGTPICRARCFPVGKVLDMILPEFLDCTARTSLEMLSKHYYQAASSWVVFFVPESDADMAFYNEFMNYLGEKQRAAVAKLDDKTTLFLVPPSDFSEKILKVPGKLSISGVILRLDQSSSSVEAQPRMSTHAEPSRTSFASPPGTFQNLGKARPNVSLPGLPPGPVPFHMNRNMAEPILENPTSGGRNFMVHQPNMMHETSSSNNYRPASPQYGHHQEPKPAIIQQDQLAQLASYLGNSRSGGDEFSKQSNNAVIHDNVYRTPQPLPSQMGSDHPLAQYRQSSQQFQQQQQVSNMTTVAEAEDDAEADPQKRLQATLELAATLLKQIQQGKS